MNRGFVLKGDLCDSRGENELLTVPGGYVVCVDGVSRGVYPQLPEEYAGLPLVDCSGKLVMPGLVDLHMHAPQYAYRGLGMDLELLDWLNTYTFPEETRYLDFDYAQAQYAKVAADLRRGAGGPAGPGGLPAGGRAASAQVCAGRAAVLTAPDGACSMRKTDGS